MGADSLINLHTHTIYSDGDYTPEQIVASAVRGHLTHVAITDHYETTKVPCLLEKDFEQYLEHIRSIGKENRDITVLAGVEIDTNPSRCDLASLNVELLNQLDIVLLEYVGSKDGSTLEELDPLLSRLETPCILVHNDLAMNYGRMKPEGLARYFADNQVGVEINTAWPYKRDGQPFYELAEHYYREFHGLVHVTVGTDVHHSLDEVANLVQPYRFLRRNGLLDDTLF